MKRKLLIFTVNIGLFVFSQLFCFVNLSFAEMRTTVKIGYAQGIELYQQSSMLTETVQYLQKNLSNYRFELVPVSPVDTIDEIRKDKIEFLIAPSNFFVGLSGKLPFTHLVTRIFDGAENPEKTVGSTLVVRSDRKDLQNLKDLKGKKCIASLPDSLGGWLAALGEIKDNGWDPDSFFKSVSFTQFQTPDVISGVLSGSADAGVLTTCVLEEAENSGLIEKRALRVINEQKDKGPLQCARSTHQLYSDMAIASLNGTPEPLIRQLTIALLSMPPIDHMRWSLSNDQYSIRQLLQELRVGPYAYLRDNSLSGIFSRYRTEILVVIGIILFLIFNEIHLRKLVNKRTRQLTNALKAKEKADRAASEERRKFANLEKNGIISQLSTIIAHEAKQPIATLTNYLQVLTLYWNRQKGEDAFFKEVLENMDSQVQRLDALVNSVRNFSKQKQNPQSRTDLNLITRKAIRNLQASEPDIEKLKIECELTSEPANILADPFSFELLILNLLRNGAQEALAYSLNETPKVTVKIEEIPNRNGYQLTVENSGHLMTDRDMARLVSLGESVKPDGLGLGLSIIRGIADHHAVDLRFSRRSSGGVIAVLIIDRFD